MFWHNQARIDKCSFNWQGLKYSFCNYEVILVRILWSLGFISKVVNTRQNVSTICCLVIYFLSSSKQFYVQFSCTKRTINTVHSNKNRIQLSSLEMTCSHISRASISTKAFLLQLQWQTRTFQTQIMNTFVMNNVATKNIQFLFHAENRIFSFNENG